MSYDRLPLSPDQKLVYTLFAFMLKHAFDIETVNRILGADYTDEVLDLYNLELLVLDKDIKKLRLPAFQSDGKYARTNFGITENDFKRLFRTVEHQLKGFLIGLGLSIEDLIEGTPYLEPGDIRHILLSGEVLQNVGSLFSKEEKDISEILHIVAQFRKRYSKDIIRALETYELELENLENQPDSPAKLSRMIDIYLGMAELYMKRKMIANAEYYALKAKQLALGRIEDKENMFGNHPEDLLRFFNVQQFFLNVGHESVIGIHGIWKENEDWMKSLDEYLERHPEAAIDKRDIWDFLEVFHLFIKGQAYLLEKRYPTAYSIFSEALEKAEKLSERGFHHPLFNDLLINIHSRLGMLYWFSILYISGILGKEYFVGLDMNLQEKYRWHTYHYKEVVRLYQQQRKTRPDSLEIIDQLIYHYNQLAFAYTNWAGMLPEALPDREAQRKKFFYRALDYYRHVFNLLPERYRDKPDSPDFVREATRVKLEESTLYLKTGDIIWAENALKDALDLNRDLPETEMTNIHLESLAKINFEMGRLKWNDKLCYKAVRYFHEAERLIKKHDTRLHRKNDLFFKMDHIERKIKKYLRLWGEGMCGESPDE
ncbi:MAG: hypothetical protein GXO24_03785 [Chlorobi bacterium]|nr:hypothetical protein [Chlorobiota bacterium]